MKGKVKGQTRWARWSGGALALLAVAVVYLALIAGRTPPAPPPAGEAHGVELVYGLEAGPCAVARVENVVLHDSQRRRRLELRIDYPRDASAAPVLVYACGTGPAAQDNASLLTRHWASHGYVCIQQAPSVPDRPAPPAPPGRAVSRDGGGPPAVGEAGPPAAPATRPVGVRPPNWDNPRLVEGRLRDLRFLVGRLHGIVEAAPELAGRMRPERLGLAGQGVSASAVAILAGAQARYPAGGPEGTLPEALPAGRVGAVLLLFPPAPGTAGLADTGWEGLRSPLMLVSGTRAGVGPGGAVASRREPFDFAPPGGKYYLHLFGAGPQNLAEAVATALPAAADAEDVAVPPAPPQPAAACLRVASTAFWDAHLKADPAAIDYLRTDALGQFSGGRARLEKK